MKVAVVKYNAGNIRSVDYALKRLGVEAVITADKEELQSADKVIFPGVGEAFLYADTGQIGDCHPGHPARRYCRFGAKALHHLSFKRKLCFKKKGCFLWKID